MQTFSEVCTARIIGSVIDIDELMRAWVASQITAPGDALGEDQSN
jgi:hypothetical protein